MMFDDFVRSSRQQPLNGSAFIEGQGFEPDDADGATSGLPPVTALETTLYGAPDMSSDAVQPIFQLGRVQYAFSAPLALLTVSSNILTMCLFNYPTVRSAQGPAPSAPPKLVRIDLDDPERTVEAEIPLTPLPRARNAPAPDPSLSGPHKMFSDPSGFHLIISMRNGDNFYWISGWKKAKALPRLKGLVIESVAWNQTAELKREAHLKRTTKEILIGTQSGDLYETMLAVTGTEEGDFLDRLAFRKAGSAVEEVDKYLHHVFRLSERQPITGLSSQIFQKSRAVVIATTSTRIYEFVGEFTSTGESAYEQLFLPYRSDAIPNLKSELPGDLPYSELHLWTPKGKRNAKALAWLTGPGIYHGALTYGDQQVGDSVVDSANLLPYPSFTFLDEDAEIPLSVALTEFHFLLLYRDRVMAISSLDDQVIFQENLPLQQHERVLGMAVDVARGSYWIYTEASIFEVVITQEDRNVWQIYLDRNNFEQSLRFVKTPAQREVVLSSQGDHFYDGKRYIQAAQCYAQTFSRTFEEIVLRFLDIEERDALRYYLVMRLERLRRENRTQRMMLATWLVEIYLSKINDLEDVAAAEEASQNVDNFVVEIELLQDELKQFFITYKDNLESRTVFDLIARHGRTELYLHYANVLGETERIVRHFIKEEEWEKALAAIVTNATTLDLYYKYAPTLIRHKPRETVDSWIKQDRLAPRRLIPACIQGDPHQVIRYLLHVAKDDATLQNLLISLLAEHDDVQLKAFLTSATTLLDLDYALRTCFAFGKIEACVRIYAKMNNYENAVDLAIQAGNVDLACTCADAVVQDRPVLRKKLWLKVARFVVEEKNDLSAAMAFLARAPDLLSIEDILPFFPDFTVIDSFKDDICNALENYAQRIDDLKLEMDQATQSADSIRADTQLLSNRFVSVEGDERCNLCQESVLQRQFYVFACSHAFHADCLIAETMRHLSPRTLRRILVLQEQISQLSRRLVPSSQQQQHQQQKVDESVTNMLASGMALYTDKLREFVLPDALVGAISASVSVGVQSGRKILAPLDPFADPTASFSKKTMPGVGGGGGGDNGGGDGVGGVGGRRQEEEERLAELREEMDGLVASACILCDGSVAAINRPFFVESGEWEL